MEKIPSTKSIGRLIRVKGSVQGVGFRPNVYRIAREMGIRGTVFNDASGVLIRAFADEDEIAKFIERILSECPPLARVESCEQQALFDDCAPDGFSISVSEGGINNTSVVPDAATCADCLEDTFSPFNRRYRYPFTNCTHCGPRLSIIKAIPYDRANTSMQSFSLCVDCRNEYDDPDDRRFHAQPNACYRCGPKAELRRLDHHLVNTESFTQLDDVDAAAGLILKGEIVAVKGLGGFHLACDAYNDLTVRRLREAKRRFDKPFAVMAANLQIIEKHCQLDSNSIGLLTSRAAPIVILDVHDMDGLSPHLAPGQKTIGFMLPYTPLHHLLMRRIKRAIVLTSGNLSDEPQCIDNEEARTRLATIADFMLCHNRDIVNRVDDSVVSSLNGRTIFYRRSRGYAPEPIALPSGFENSPPILAMGAELKNTFCLLQNGRATVSQHMGDLSECRTFEDYKRSISLYRQIFESKPVCIAVDRHPEYLSTKFGREMAIEDGIEVEEITHHHAHIASCMVENEIPLDGEPVLGVALDGLGYGDDGTLWGGEFLLCRYHEYRRLATFKPVAMLGGTRAILEPWRSTYAHLMAEIGWNRLKLDYDGLELLDYFESKSLKQFDQMLKNDIYAPRASSCGRLFDAVAAAVGIRRDSITYEGQAAIELESIVDKEELLKDDEFLVYPFTIPRLKSTGMPYVEPIGMWQALLGDLICSTSPGVIAARFHKGLAKVIVSMVGKLAENEDSAHFSTVALCGGVFQNKILLQLTSVQLDKRGFKVVTPRQMPANDAGISLGQVAVCAARRLKEASRTCV
ncbi:MAG: carbamoyltransferase HypF [Candidatus Melainabacteria bacterium]|nr:MAG: carbamoyltransferase HypF [Candidatus Melainabacteria bacterium]